MTLAFPCKARDLLPMLRRAAAERGYVSHRGLVRAGSLRLDAAEFVHLETGDRKRIALGDDPIASLDEALSFIRTHLQDQ